jgi:hypothetical protein
MASLIGIMRGAIVGAQGNTRIVVEKGNTRNTWNQKAALSLPNDKYE